MTSTLQTLLLDHGALAVFVVMAVDAVLPVGGELTMLLAGALAAGAFGVPAHDAPVEYVWLASAGTLGYLAGSLGGWWVGLRGGRGLIERRGRWLHLGPERFARAEAWFDRYGRLAVFFGRLTPLVRSFVSIPAGVLRAPLLPYLALTALASAIWCFGFAGAGWALGDQYQQIHHGMRYVELAAGLGLLALLAFFARGVFVRRIGSGR